MCCVLCFVHKCLSFSHCFTDIDLRLLITPLLTFLKCRNILNLSSSPVFSGIRLIFSLCSVLLTNVCLLVICLRDIDLRLLITPLITCLKCSNRSTPRCSVRFVLLCLYIFCVVLGGQMFVFFSFFIWTYVYGSWLPLC
jgi:hypothetical protein